MTPGTQAVALMFLGAVLVRLAVTDAYVRYVNDWMRWPVLISGVALLGLALVEFLTQHRRRNDADDGHEHGTVPRVTWLLILPGIVFFVISPPSLGAYVAERNSNEQPPPAQSAAAFSPLPGGDPVEVNVSDFVWRAQIDEGRTLEGRNVVLTGFVSQDDDDAWYVTRLSIACCAADAAAFRIRVEDAEAPPRNQWVQVTGTWVEDSGVTPRDTPAITATAVETTSEPAQPYE